MVANPGKRVTVYEIAVLLFAHAELFAQARLRLRKQKVDSQGHTFPLTIRTFSRAKTFPSAVIGRSMSVKVHESSTVTID